MLSNCVYVHMCFFLQLPSEVECSDETAKEKIGHFRSQTLFEFLLQLYRRSIDDEARDVFHEIGIHT